MFAQSHYNLAFPDLHGLDLMTSEPALVIPIKIHKCDMASTMASECRAKEQTAEHVITSCPIYQHPNGARAFSDVNNNPMTWLMETRPAFSETSSSCPSPPNEKNVLGKRINLNLMMYEDRD